MKAKAKKTADDDAMRPSYDFSEGVRGKYAAHFREGSNVVLIDSDLSKVFPDSEAVNSALRVLANAARLEVRKPSRTSRGKPGPKAKTG